jgi:SAM-dependent methyltransferase
MVDALFAVPRLAAIYDALEPDRSDLDAYLEIVEEFRVSSVLDVGCGTGTLACLLAQGGKLVVGVDPALASLDVARRKPGADGVRWVHGDATTVSPVRVELTAVALPLVSFQTTFVFASGRATLTSHSTLRFRGQNEITASLRAAGFAVQEVRDAQDRPGLEMVFVAAAVDEQSR